MTNTAFSPTRFVPSMSAVLFILLFLGALLSGPEMLNIDGDLPRHLLMGKVVLERGSAPTTEIYSYAYENEPYTPHEWFADVLLYFVYLPWGLNGVVILAAVLIASTFSFLYSEAVARNERPVLTFLLIFLGATVTSIHWVARPHLFTMLFLAVWLILSERLYRGSPMSAWIFPALMLLWANIHAEFIAGFLVLFAYIAGCAWQYLLWRSPSAWAMGKKFLRITLLSFIASLLNPVGWRTWDIVFRYINNRYLVSRIVETRPPDFSQPEFLPLLTLLGVALLLWIARRKIFMPAHVLLLAGFGAMSLLAARNVHLAGVVLPFVLSLGLRDVNLIRPLEVIETMLARMGSQSNRLLWYVVAPFVISIILLAGPMGKLNRFDPAIFPVDAVRWLETHPQSGRMFNAFDWGGYLLFHLWPQQKVFIDSQADVKGDLTREYEAAITMQDGWHNIFEKHKITWAILPPGWPLTNELISRGWEIVYQDATALILVKH